MFLMGECVYVIIQSCGFSASVFHNCLDRRNDLYRTGAYAGAIAKRFTIIAWLSMIVLAITGWMKTPDDALFDTSAGYGLTLTIKHILYIAAVLIGIAITFVFAPKIRKYTPKPGEAPSPIFLGARSKLEILSSSNMVIGVAIIVLASML